MTLLREYTDAVHRLLRGETVTVDGRYVHLDAVALDWPPAVVPPLIVGARGPKTVSLAGEVGDGVLLDAQLVTGADETGYVAESVERVGAAATAAGRPAPQVVTFVEVDPQAPDLAARVATTVEGLVAAGATTVILQGTGEAPDPAPLIAALAR